MCMARITAATASELGVCRARAHARTTSEHECEKALRSVEWCGVCPCVLHLSCVVACEGAQREKPHPVVAWPGLAVADGQQ